MNFSSLILHGLCCFSMFGPGWVPSWAAHGGTSGQLNMLPNPTFSTTGGQPAGWKLVNCQGRWIESVPGRQAALSVRGTGTDHGYWRSDNIRVQPGSLYEMRFVGRREGGASGGTALAGLSRINRDFALDGEWRQYGFVFMTPHDTEDDYFRLGQWEVNGEVVLSEPLMRPALASHLEVRPGLELGEGESIQHNRYLFMADYNWNGGNFHRPLALNRAGFNSNRWLFWPGAEVVYKHSVGAHRQTTGKVLVAINHHVGGSLLVEASRDGWQWIRVAQFDGQKRGGEVDLPVAMYPAQEVFVRLAQAGDGAGFQVNSYVYDAQLEGNVPDAEGSTVFIVAAENRAGLVTGAQPRPAGSPYCIGVCVTNASGNPLVVEECAWQEHGGDETTAKTKKSLANGEHGAFGFDLRFSGAGERKVRLALRSNENDVVWAGETTVRIGILENASYGYWLAEQNGLAVWWCESGWKVGRNRPSPDRAAAGRTNTVRVSAARGEYEPVQIVLRPHQDMELLGIEVGNWSGPREARAWPSVRVDEVAYVHVTQPTDGTCMRGWYPDPLPPLKTPLSLKGGLNQPLWLTIWVPHDLREGDYSASAKVRTSAGEVDVPLKLHVYGFELPRETHLRSALGLGAGTINTYHGLVDADQKIAVFEKYLRNFATHRISPYSFFDYAHIEVRFVGEGTNRNADVDFSRFDRAAGQWLGPGGFNTFQLPVQGMGGGTFQERHLGTLADFQEGTPEHERIFRDYLGQVEAHLEQRGWRDKAFIYWFDEPDPKDYEFVVAGMKRLKEAAPGIRRMLTEQPEPALIGHVDIWCALTPEWTPERVRKRHEAGDEVWWYICTGPKAPYVTEFIDHPGTELRLWPWQSWQYGIDGILIWATIYWHSPVAYPRPQLQNPWADPMSWVSGYGTPVGTRSPWGNGDGRFLYPPRREPNRDNAPCLDEPINSMRWENLRDGMEDYEYFWLLSEEVKRLSKVQSAGALDEARALLTVPANVSRDLTNFTTDPRPMLEHRQRVANMLERVARER